jgi:dynein heavy chain
MESLSRELLAQLSSAKGSVVDNITLIDVLQATKTASADIEAKHKSASDATHLLDGTRSAFMSVAVRGAVLFLTGTALSSILPCYQLSFGRFLHLFKRALQRAAPSRAIEQRCELRACACLSDATCLSCWWWCEIAPSLRRMCVCVADDGAGSHSSVTA